MEQRQQQEQQQQQQQQQEQGGLTMGGVLARPLSLASAAGRASTSSAAARSIVTPIT
eukprot:COSAG04_NODE_16001_length_513_cov_0.611111_1_plen_56_part_10